MSMTLATCTSFLILLGCSLCAWLCGHPLVFVPYLFLVLALVSARGLGCRAIVLVLALLTVVTGFGVFWDAEFVHGSTLNVLPDLTVLVQSILACSTWLAITVVEFHKQKKERAA